jgi:hypothetical protein
MYSIKLLVVVIVAVVILNGSYVIIIGIAIQKIKSMVVTLTENIKNLLLNKGVVFWDLYIQKDYINVSVIYKYDIALTVVRFYSYYVAVYVS